MDYDVVICGAGPAGLSTGISILHYNKDAKILILESRKEVSEDKCAEGVSENWFLRMNEFGSFLKSKLKKESIENEMYGMLLVLPDGEKIKMRLKERQGYMLNKDFFLKNLSEVFQSMGGTIKTGTSASKPIVKDDKVEGVETSDGEIIKGKYIVDATGVSQNVWRKTLNITEPLDKKDIEICFQYKVVDSNIEDYDLVHMYFGNQVAPGGYAWIFPKGPKRANIGLGCQGSKVSNAYPFMEKFWNGLNISGEIVSKKGGTVSTFDIPKDIVWSNLALVGASARFTDPVTGGGIGPGLVGGHILGKHLSLGIKNETSIEKPLLDYQDEIKSLIGNKHKNSYRIKSLFQDLNDEELKIVFKSITEEEWKNILNLTKSDMLKIVARITKKKLKLGLKMPKYLKL